MFNVLLAADDQLDRPLGGLDRYEGSPIEAIRGAARRVFSNRVQLAITERIDLVLLSGDI